MTTTTTPTLDECIDWLRETHPEAWPKGGYYVEELDRNTHRGPDIWQFGSDYAVVDYAHAIIESAVMDLLYRAKMGVKIEPPYIDRGSIRWHVVLIDEQHKGCASTRLHALLLALMEIEQ